MPNRSIRHGVVECILCDAKIFCNETPATTYEGHLLNEHHVTSSHMDVLLDRMRREKGLQTMAEDKECQTDLVAEDNEESGFHNGNSSGSGFNEPSDNGTSNERASVEMPAPIVSLPQPDPNLNPAPLETSLQIKAEAVDGGLRAVSLEHQEVRNCLVVVPKLKMPISRKWYEGSNYQCQICDKMYYDADGLTEHVSTLVHKVPMDRYLLDFGKLCTEPRLYNCRICDCNLKHEKATIERHLKEKHEGVSLLLYAEIYHPNGLGSRSPPVDAEKAGDDIEVQETMSVTKSETPKKEPKKIVKPERPKDVGFREGFNEWLNATTYVCHACGRGSKTCRGLAGHVTKVHQISRLNYSKKFGVDISESFKNVAKEKCKICSEEVIQSHFIIGNHMRSHGLSSYAYYEKFYIGHEDEASSAKETSGPRSRFRELNEWANQIQFYCKSCDKDITQSQHLFEKHISDEHGVEGMKNWKEPKFSKIIEHNCKICGKSVNHTLRSLVGHVSHNHQMQLGVYYNKYINTNNPRPIAIKKKSVEKNGKCKKRPNGAEATAWANKCAYNCTLCDGKIDYYSLVAFKKHLLEAHEMRMTDYVARTGSRRPNKEHRHYCLLCGCNLRHTKPSIQLHTIKSHGITLTKYFARYVREDLVEYKLTPKAPKRKSGSSSNLQVAKKRKLSLERPESDSQRREREFREWRDRCKWDCKLCDFQTFSRHGIGLHMWKLHNLPGQDALDENVNFTLAEYECKICSKVIPQTQKSLSEHMKTHKYCNLRAYYQAHYSFNPEVGRFLATDSGLDEEWGSSPSTADVPELQIQNAYTVSVAADLLDEYGLKSEGSAD